MTWHINEIELRRYARAEVTDAHAASIETHLNSCADCRRIAVTAVDTDALGRVKDAIDAA